MTFIQETLVFKGHLYSRDTFRSHTGVPGKEVPPYNLVIRYLVEKDTSGQGRTFLVPKGAP